MADFDFPTAQEIVQRMQNDFQTELDNSNPFLDNSFMQSLLTANAGRYYENYIQLNFVFNSLFLSTSTDDFLDSYGSLYGITRLSATQAAGLVTATGTVSTVISAGELLQNSSGDQYEVDSDASISAVSYSISTLTRSGSTVTATTANDHNLASGITVTIAGVNETDYNGDFVIVVSDSTTFTYTISTTPSTPATGTITASIDLASISVTAVDFGEDTDADSGDKLTFLSVIGGVDDGVGYVQTDGLSGGADSESDDDYRTRITNRIQNPVAQFSTSAIEDQAFLINGVTRVWVQEETPATGQVTIYFVRDNDAVIIPTTAEITEVKNSILEIKPATINDSDVVVSAPTQVDVDFIFTFLDPSTTTMQDSITANLQQYFEDKLGVNDDVLELAYNSVIYNTIDLTTGDTVSDFTLSSPSGDVAVASNEIALLNSVTYS